MVNVGWCCICLCSRIHLEKILYCGALLVTSSGTSEHARAYFYENVLNVCSYVWGT